MSDPVEDFDNDIEEAMEKEAPPWDKQEEEGEFEGEVYFSTDGKHTVHAKSSTPEGRESGLGWAFKAYERIVEKLGTKAEMWETTINGKKKVEQPSLLQRPCSKEGCQGTQTFRQGVSKKTGKPWKAWFCDLVKEHGDFV